VLVTSSVTDLGGRSGVVLRLANTGVAAVRVETPVLPGFAIRPRMPLPVLLPGRPPGPQPARSLVEHELVFDAAVAECKQALATLDAAKKVGGNPDDLRLLVHGPAGSGEAVVDVPGLETFLEQASAIGCPAAPRRTPALAVPRGPLRRYLI
jgi:hypothetical protein